MSTSAWSTEAWTDTQASVGGVTDLTKIRWQADWSGEADGGVLGSGGVNNYGMWSITGQVSSEQTLNGRKSVKDHAGPSTTLPDGTSAYPVGFGRTVQDGTYGQEGAEYWLRVWVYHKSPYTWETDTGTRKFFRMRTKSQDGSYAGGAMDWNIIAPSDLDIGDNLTVTAQRENVFSNTGLGWVRSWYNGAPNTPLMLEDTWQCFEVYTKASTVQDAGSIMLWRDGVLIWEADAKTLPTSTTSPLRVEDLMFVSNWNSGLNSEVDWYWTAPAIAVKIPGGRDDTPHMAQDSAGNYMIGTAT